MWNLESDFVTTLVLEIGNAFTAFLPLWAAVTGMFLAFAAANMSRFFISRAIK